MWPVKERSVRVNPTGISSETRTLTKNFDANSRAHCQNKTLQRSPAKQSVRDARRHTLSVERVPTHRLIGKNSPLDSLTTICNLNLNLQLITTALSRETTTHSLCTTRICWRRGPGRWRWPRTRRTGATAPRRCPSRRRPATSRCEATAAPAARAGPAGNRRRPTRRFSRSCFRAEENDDARPDRIERSAFIARAYDGSHRPGSRPRGPSTVVVIPGRRVPSRIILASHCGRPTTTTLRSHDRRRSDEIQLTVKLRRRKSYEMTVVVCVVIALRPQ